MRAQFSDAVNIELGLRSLRTFETFEREFDQEIDLHQVGYLFLLDQPEHVEAFEKNVALQNELGVPSRMIDVAEAKRLSPLIDTEGLLAAACSPDGRALHPGVVVLGYARAARRAGARLVRGCAVTGIATDGGTITAVETSRGTIATDTVICAAGAWSGRLGDHGGRRPPVEPLRRQILTTEPMPGLDPHTPFTIDFSTSFYFHGEGPGLLLGMSDPDETPGFKLSRVRRLAARGSARRSSAGPRRSPRSASPAGWAGLYEMTPDHNALVGEAHGSVPVPVRHRLLRARLPDGTRRRRGDARPLPGQPTRRRRQRPRRAAASTAAVIRPELNIV